jgi:hypothetical protein
MIALFVMIVLSLLGVALLTLSGTEHNIAYNALWAEGSLAAADAGIQTGVNQLTASTSASIAAIPLTTIGTGIYQYNFRSGHRTDPGPEPLVFRGSRVESGYSIALGTGYNPSGYAFQTYQINTTGLGARNAQRELEALAEYGPVAQ